MPPRRVGDNAPYQLLRTLAAECETRETDEHEETRGRFRSDSRPCGLSTSGNICEGHLQCTRAGRRTRLIRLKME